MCKQTKELEDGISDDMKQDAVGCEKQTHFCIDMIDIIDPNVKCIANHVH